MDMSDKNQSSVRWLVEKIQQANPSFKFDALIRQAKAMHKQEIIKAYCKALPIEDGITIAINKGDDYYSKQYEDNNE